MNAIDKLAKLQSEWNSIKADQNYGTAQATKTTLYSESASANLYFSTSNVKEMWVSCTFTITFDEPVYYIWPDWAMLHDYSSYGKPLFNSNEGFGMGRMWFGSTDGGLTWTVNLRARYTELGISAGNVPAGTYGGRISVVATSPFRISSYSSWSYS